MSIWPNENITYKTSLEFEEVFERLSDFIEPEKSMRFYWFRSSNVKAYEGYIGEKWFEIKKILGYRNNFAPRILGSITKDEDGTIIKVKMIPERVVLIAVSIWCGLVGIGGIFYAIQQYNKSEIGADILFPFVMMLIGYGLTWAAFKSESETSIDDLRKLFEAEIVENNV